LEVIIIVIAKKNGQLHISDKQNENAKEQKPSFDKSVLDQQNKM